MMRWSRYLPQFYYLKSNWLLLHCNSFLIKLLQKYFFKNHLVWILWQTTGIPFTSESWLLLWTCLFDTFPLEPKSSSSQLMSLSLHDKLSCLFANKYQITQWSFSFLFLAHPLAYCCIVLAISKRNVKCSYGHFLASKSQRSQLITTL